MKKSIKSIIGTLLLLGMLLCLAETIRAVEVKIQKEPWTIQADNGIQKQSFDVAGPDLITIKDAKLASLPLFDAKRAPWSAGLRLPEVIAYECTVRHAVDLSSVKLRLDLNKDEYLVLGKDYQVNDWGTLGRLEGGAISEGVPVYVSYQYVKMRLDSIVQNADGSMTYCKGTPHVSLPVPPEIQTGQKRLANIWISGKIDKLSDDLIFVIEKSAIEQSPAMLNAKMSARKLVPKTWKKLISGEEVTILAWGDSVTDASYLPVADRWQQQFVIRLRKAFPMAKITMLTEAWGGRNSDTYRNEPAGSPKNYKEKVLAVKPDLIISEFVNDSGMNSDRVQLRYGEMLKDFQSIGTEWIILTPHYVRPDWMGLTQNKNIDNDPRPYVAGLRKFTKENNIALADAALLYGQLWREGVPYLTLLTNNINHPNKQGMKLFADALMNLFVENEKK